MNFAARLSLKNIKRKPFRTMGLALLAAVLSFSLFIGAFVIFSLQRGLESYRARLGADIVVVPSSAASHGMLDDILLQGITGNHYMSAKDCEKVCALEGIESVSKQFFLTSAKASCCSTRVQIIGFDPETDFSILPWIGENYTGTIEDGDVVVGANLNISEDRLIRFYGREYRVVARLEETGTGLDSTVYTNMNTIREMAKNAARLLETSPFRGVNIDTAASAIMIRVADGYDINSVMNDINIHITKVQATSAKSMVLKIISGLERISEIIGLLVAAIWFLAIVILLIVFATVLQERKREFGVLRIAGASCAMLTRIMCTEAVIVSLSGALIGLFLSVMMVYPLMDSIRNALELPFLKPNPLLLLLLFLGTLCVSVLMGGLASAAAAQRITKNETALIVREDI